MRRCSSMESSEHCPVYHWVSQVIKFITLGKLTADPPPIPTFFIEKKKCSLKRSCPIMSFTMSRGKKRPFFFYPKTVFAPLSLWDVLWMIWTHVKTSLMLRESSQINFIPSKSKSKKFHLTKKKFWLNLYVFFKKKKFDN